MTMSKNVYSNRYCSQHLFQNPATCPTLEADICRMHVVYFVLQANAIIGGDNKDLTQSGKALCAL
jgi:hypothetical protein